MTPVLKKKIRLLRAGTAMLEPPPSPSLSRPSTGSSMSAHTQAASYAPPPDISGLNLSFSPSPQLLGSQILSLNPTPTRKQSALGAAPSTISPATPQPFPVLPEYAGPTPPARVAVAGRLGWEPEDEEELPPALSFSMKDALARSSLNSSNSNRFATTPTPNTTSGARVEYGAGSAGAGVSCTHP